MFLAYVLPNLLVFAAGQATALLYLRTGRSLPGWLGTIVLWTSLDAWILLEFVFGEPGWLPRSLLQATALLLVSAWAMARWRRRWSAAARQRSKRFRDGLVHMLQGNHGAVERLATQLVRTDPWDPAAWILLGDAYRHGGKLPRATRCYRRAAAVDQRAEFADLLQHYRRAVVRPGPTPAAVAPATTSSAPGRAASG